jgi:hypothetical protein
VHNLIVRKLNFCDKDHPLEGLSVVITPRLLLCLKTAAPG